MMGLKGIVLAAGLALAGLGQAAAQAPAPQAPVAAPAAPAKANPMLALDGAPAMLPVAGMGMPVDGKVTLQPQVTPNGERARRFHDYILLPLIVFICLFVLVLLGWVVVFYRRAAHPVATKTSHNTVLEVLWTGLPVLILLAIALPSIGLLNAQFKPAPDNAVTLKAIGNQWYWSYQYPDNGGFEITANMLKEKNEVSGAERARTDADGPRLLATDNRVVLPYGVPIRLITTSNDVIHSWAIPAFWIKLDAVPGRLNETSFTIEKPGVYFGVCSELCGARHGYMPITVEAVAPAVFAQWVKAKGGTMPTGKPAAVVAAGQPLPETGAAFEAGNSSAPADNATAQTPTITQGATANPAGAGNAGQ